MKLSTFLVSCLIYSMAVVDAGWERPKHKSTPMTEKLTTIAVVEPPTPTVADLDTTTVKPSKIPPWMRPKTKKPVVDVELLTTTSSVLPIEAALETTTPVAIMITSSPKLETDSLALLTTSEQPILLNIDTTTIAPVKESTPMILEISTMGPDVVVESSTMPPLVTETPVMPKKTRKPKPTKLPAIDFQCRHKEDGYYANPKDKCSSIYYACVGGLGREMRCAGKDLVYEPDMKNPLSGQCENRHESFRCTGMRKTTPPSTPRAPPPPTPAKLLIDCSMREDGWYPDPSKKCSHVFFSCSNGIGSQFDCPGRMYFDVASKLCLSYQEVEACIGRKPDTTKKPKPTTPAAPKEKLPIDCSEKESGSYADPLKKCSRIYYVCSNGDGFKRQCPDNTFFDKKKQLCDFYDEVWECSYRTKAPSTTTTKGPVPSVASLPSNEFNCTGKVDKSYLSKKCSSSYYRCVGGVTYKAHCPRGLYYDLKNDLCDRWANLYECSGKYPTSPKPTESTKAPVIEKLPVDCTKYPDGDFPDPEKKCSSIYYSCSGQVGQRRQCPLITYFDKDFGICDTKDNVPACSGKPKPKTPKPTPRRPIPVTKSPYDCEKRKDGNYPFGKCHQKYWSCVGGSATLSVCPAKTYYDTEMNECGHKEEVPACGGTRRTPSPHVTKDDEEH